MTEPGRAYPPWGEPGPVRRELLVALGVLLVVVAALYSRHLWRGGFLVDDYVWLWHFQEVGRSLGSGLDLLDAWGDWPGYRSAATVLQVFYYLLVGESVAGHLAFGIVFLALVCWLLFIVLRMVGMKPPVAGSAALLLAVFPFLDVARLNFSAFQQTIAGGFYLGGVALALHGIRSAKGTPAKVAWHLAALCCYFIAASTHEAYIALVPGSVLLYMLVGTRREALLRWPADLAMFGVVYLTLGSAASETRGGDLTLTHLWTRLGEVSEGTVEVFNQSLPADELLWGPLGAVLFAAAAVGLVIALRSGDEQRRAVVQWARIAAGGLAFVVLGLAPLLPAASDLTPVWEGFNSRVFVVSSLGFAVLLVAFVFLVATGWSALLRFKAPTTAVALFGVAAFAIPFAHEELRNQDEWAEAQREQERILDAVGDGIGPELPGGGKVAAVTFRHPFYTDDGALIFIFALWDLDGALKLRYDTTRIVGTPFLTGTTCGPTGVGIPRFAGFPPEIDVPYGSVYFVDAFESQTIRVNDRRVCEAEMKRLRKLSAADALAGHY